MNMFSCSFSWLGNELVQTVSSPCIFPVQDDLGLCQKDLNGFALMRGHDVAGLW
jgi:hypothetical protein